jgi:methylglyoxal synthase
LDPDVIGAVLAHDVGETGSIRRESDDPAGVDVQQFSSGPVRGGEQQLALQSPGTHRERSHQHRPVAVR